MVGKWKENVSQTKESNGSLRKKETVENDNKEKWERQKRKSNKKAKHLPNGEADAMINTWRQFGWKKKKKRKRWPRGQEGHFPAAKREKRTGKEVLGGQLGEFTAG